MRRNLSDLSAAKGINSTATLRDQVNSQSNAADLFRFELGQASRLNVKFRSSGQGANLRLIQDRNGNRRIDSGEVLRSARMGSQQGDVTLPQIAGGTYYVQVMAGSDATNRYQLNLTSAALPSNSAPARPAPAPAPTPAPAPSFIDQIVTLTNNFRSQNGLAPVRLNTQLTTAAQNQSQGMALQDYFDHVSPTGTTPGQRATAAGYRWSRVSENIGAGYTTAAGVVQGWIDSPGHRANMLDPKVSEIGVGYFFLGNDTGNENWNYYWTQVFGSPM